MAKAASATEAFEQVADFLEHFTERDGPRLPAKGLYRPDYVQRRKDPNFQPRVTPEEFVDWSLACVNRGVQIVGGCCGIEIEHIIPLRDALPKHMPQGG